MFNLGGQAVARKTPKELSEEKKKLYEQKKKFSERAQKLKKEDKNTLEALRLFRQIHSGEIRAGQVRASENASDHFKQTAKTVLRGYNKVVERYNIAKDEGRQIPYEAEVYPERKSQTPREPLQEVSGNTSVIPNEVLGPLGGKLFSEVLVEERSRENGSAAPAGVQTKEWHSHVDAHSPRFLKKLDGEEYLEKETPRPFNFAIAARRSQTTLEKDVQELVQGQELVVVPIRNRVHFLAKQAATRAVEKASVRVTEDGSFLVMKRKQEAARKKRDGIVWNVLNRAVQRLTQPKETTILSELRMFSGFQRVDVRAIMAALREMPTNIKSNPFGLEGLLTLLSHLKTPLVAQDPEALAERLYQEISRDLKHRPDKSGPSRGVHDRSRLANPVESRPITMLANEPQMDLDWTAVLQSLSLFCRGTQEDKFSFGFVSEYGLPGFSRPLVTYCSMPWRIVQYWLRVYQGVDVVARGYMTMLAESTQERLDEIFMFRVELLGLDDSYRDVKKKGKVFKDIEKLLPDDGGDVSLETWTKIINHNISIEDSPMETTMSVIEPLFYRPPRTDPPDVLCHAGDIDEGGPPTSVDIYNEKKGEYNRVMALANYKKKVSQGPGGANKGRGFSVLQLTANVAFARGEEIAEELARLSQQMEAEEALMEEMVQEMVDKILTDVAPPIHGDEVLKAQQPPIISELQHVTGFAAVDCEMCYDAFKLTLEHGGPMKAHSLKTEDVIHISRFVTTMCRLLGMRDLRVASAIFKEVDTSNSDYVKAVDILPGILLLCHGTKERKIRLLHRLSRRAAKAVVKDFAIKKEKLLVERDYRRSLSKYVNTGEPDFDDEDLGSPPKVADIMVQLSVLVLEKAASVVHSLAVVYENMLVIDRCAVLDSLDDFRGRLVYSTNTLRVRSVVEDIIGGAIVLATHPDEELRHKVIADIDKRQEKQLKNRWLLRPIVMGAFNRAMEIVTSPLRVKQESKKALDKKLYEVMFLQDWKNVVPPRWKDTKDVSNDKNDLNREALAPNASFLDVRRNRRQSADDLTRSDSVAANGLNRRASAPIFSEKGSQGPAKVNSASGGSESSSSHGGDDDENSDSNSSGSEHHLPHASPKPHGIRSESTSGSSLPAFVLHPYLNEKEVQIDGEDDGEVVEAMETGSRWWFKTMHKQQWVLKHKEIFSLFYDAAVRTRKTSILDDAKPKKREKIITKRPIQASPKPFAIARSQLRSLVNLDSTIDDLVEKKDLRKVGNERMTKSADVMHREAVTWSGYGDHDKAIRLLQKEYLIAKDLQDIEREHRAVEALIRQYDDGRDHANLITWLFKLAALLEDEEFHGSNASKLRKQNTMMLVQLYKRIGEEEQILQKHQECVDAWQEALDLATGIRDVQQQGDILEMLAQQYERRNEFEEMEETLEQYLHVAESAALSKTLIGSLYGRLGTANYFMKEYKTAIKYYKQRLALADEELDELAKGIACTNLGLCHRYIARLDEAHDYHTRACQIARIVGDSRLLCAAYNGMGIIEHGRRRYDEAAKCHLLHYEHAKKLQDHASILRALSNLYAAYVAAGDHYRSLEVEQLWKSQKQAVTQNMVTMQSPRTTNESNRLQELAPLSPYVKQATSPSPLLRRLSMEMGLTATDPSPTPEKSNVRKTLGIEQGQEPMESRFHETNFVQPLNSSHTQSQSPRESS